MKIISVLLKVSLVGALGGAAATPYIYVKYFKNAGTTAQDVQAPNNAGTGVPPTDGSQQTTPPTNPTVATPLISTTNQNPFRFAESGQGIFETSMPGGS